MAGKYPHPVFGWDRVRLSDLTLRQLAELREAIVSDAANENHKEGVNQYTHDANRKLDALSWAVFNRMKYPLPN